MSSLFDKAGGTLQISPKDYWRIAAVVMLFFGTQTLVSIGWAASWHVNRIDDAEDLLILVLPFVCILAALASSAAVLVDLKVGRVSTGVIRGIFVAANAFALFTELTLSRGSLGDLRDGVGYWAALSIPSFWIGIPLILLGGLVGARRAGAAIPYFLIGLAAALAFHLPAMMLFSKASEWASDLFVWVFA